MSETPVFTTNKPMYREADLIVKIRDLNPHIVCALCAGYFIDATTITECSHTFCKSCIVKHFQTKKSCPECGQQIHETQPLNNLRSDRVMQDVVYKLVPNLFKNEQEAEAKFYRCKGIDFTQSGSHLLNIGTPLKYTQQKLIRDSTNAEVTAIDIFKIPNYKTAHIPQHDEKLTLRLSLHPDMDVREEEGLYFVRSNDCTVNFKPLKKPFVRCSSRFSVSHLLNLLQHKLCPSTADAAQIFINMFSNGRKLDSTVILKKIFLSQYYASERVITHVDLSYKLIPVRCAP